MASGVACIVVGTGIVLLTIGVGWRRVPGSISIALLVLGGVLVGAGGLLVQDHVGAGDWIVALSVLGALAPLHFWLVLGRPGPVVAAEGDAAYKGPRS